MSAIQRIAKELSQNLEHACVSGVEVMQELNRVHGRTFQAVAPFIFTTPIGVEKGNRQVQNRNWMFQELFFSERVPHTACVNAIKSDPSGTACASMDIVHGVFPKEVVDGVYTTYNKLLDVICSSDPSVWKTPINTLLPSLSCAKPMAPPCKTSDKLLHEIFMDNASDSPAVIAYTESGGKLVIGYKQLQAMMMRVACGLFECVHNFKTSFPQEGASCVVAVIMEKGWEQVAGVLGIHRIQSVYLPIDARLWSEHRIRQVLEMSEAVAVLTQSHVISANPWMSSLEIPLFNVSEVLEKSFNLVDDIDSETIKLINEIPRARPEDLAYLIYTSGSTGCQKECVVII